MRMEAEPKEQNLSSGGSPSVGTTLTLQQAIDFGEYNPGYLSNFSEWHTLSGHIQWQLIRRALDIRQQQLLTHYAELSSSLEFSKKPHVQEAMKNVERQLRILAQDKEQLYVEYSSKM